MSGEYVLRVTRADTWLTVHRPLQVRFTGSDLKLQSVSSCVCSELFPDTSVGVAGSLDLKDLRRLHNEINLPGKIFCWAPAEPKWYELEYIENAFRS